MKKEIQEYIKTTGLDHLDWYDWINANEDTLSVHANNFDEFGFVIIDWNREQLSLELVRFDVCESFMSMDDLGWSGPVKMVAAFAPCKIFNTALRTSK